MRTLIISYDLAKPHRNKHIVAQAIMALGQSWARPLEQTWYIRTDASEALIELHLSTLLDPDDGLLIQAVIGAAISGGWRVIGRTPLAVFDAGRAEPSLFLAGDRVRFRPIDAQEFARLAGRK